MKVTLAYPWGGHPPDSTVDLDAVVAGQLLRSGRARPPALADDDAAPAGDTAPTDPEVDDTSTTTTETKEEA